MRKSSLRLMWASILSVGISATADAAVFDFTDPKGVNSAAFVLDSPLEPIMGVAQGVTGTVEFDPANPGATTGSFVFAADAIETANDRMTEVLHSDRYLDVAVYPEVTFNVRSIADVHEVGDNVWRGRITGDLTLHGVTKPLTALVDVTWLPGAAGERMKNAEGDLLVLRSMFTINRFDYEIAPDNPKMVIAENIEVRLAVVGIEP